MKIQRINNEEHILIGRNNTDFFEPVIEAGDLYSFQLSTMESKVKINGNENGKIKVKADADKHISGGGNMWYAMYQYPNCV
jgi:hypothetical protein